MTGKGSSRKAAVAAWGRWSCCDSTAVVMSGTPGGRAAHEHPRGTRASLRHTSIPASTRGTRCYSSAGTCRRWPLPLAELLCLLLARHLSACPGPYLNLPSCSAAALLYPPAESQSCVTSISLFPQPWSRCAGPASPALVGPLGLLPFANPQPTSHSRRVKLCPSHPFVLQHPR